MKEPTFRDLFGEGRRRNRGRGAWRTRGSYASGQNRGAPGRGYGGNHAASSYGSWGSSYDRDSTEGYGRPRQSYEQRERVGVGASHADSYHRGDMNRDWRPGLEASPSGRGSGLLFASARVPRPAPVPEHDDNLTSRKKRKFVPGGRIGKYIKAQEFQTVSLYCDVCERDFYDENAKALHDRSKDHSDNHMRMRKAEIEAAARSNVKDEETMEGKPVVRAIGLKEMAAFVKEHAAKWTKSFKGWANRSIEGAKAAADAANDQNIVASVQREILFEFRYHTDNCTMMQESWGRKPAATGIHYRQAQPSVFTDRVFSEKEKRKMDEERRQALLTHPTSTDLAEIVSAAPNPSVAEVRDDLVLAPEVQGRISSADKNSTSAPSGYEDLERVNVSSDRIREPNELALPERQIIEAPVKVSWKLSQAACVLSSICNSGISEAVAARYRQKFPRTWRTSKSHSGQVPNNDLVMKYRDLRSKYESQEFDYNSWRGGLDEVISGFTAQENRIGSLKKCLHMQIDAAIRRGDWTGCTISCAHLIEFHNSHDSFEEGDGEYIGYWIIAGLFKAQNGLQRRLTSRAGQKRLFSLVTRLRALPPGVMDDMFVDHAYAMFKSAVSNNYYQFCQLQADPMVDMKTGGNFKRMTEKVGDFVRERALVTMTMLSGITNEVCYSNPMAVDFDFVMRSLKWSNQSGEENISESRRFIEGLPQEIRIDDTYPELMMLLVSSHRAVLQSSEVVDVDTLARVVPNAFEIQ